MKANISLQKKTFKTYPVASPEKAPVFLENRTYQGSSGKVYPLPVTEKIEEKAIDVEYDMLVLSNDFVEIWIMPELGGRIQRALDKTNGYDFIYFNHVVKPALVGLTGPWISGGIEFNWPQHHRPTTYSPVQYSYKENSDGSVSVILGDTDVMYGTKETTTITVYPDKSYMEIRGSLYNPTDFPQTFLWWANPAVSVNDHTFSVFPPDVTAVYDHGKRDVSTFPIATGTYYKCDYSKGVDISRYKNIPVPTSFMAAHSDFDFIGNYDESVGAGLLHVADHHVSPGKKQWTWGNSDFGKMWDKNLTDADGPYIELMTGVFTDNQPDFSWLMPHESKEFTQFFMPYKGVGRVCQANKNMVLGVENGTIRIYSSGVFDDCVLHVENAGKKSNYEMGNMSPKDFYENNVGDLKDYVITVTDGKGRELLYCKEFKKTDTPTPKPAAGMASPKDIRTNEELWLAGQHLEQYRHATYRPEDYYLEGLERDKSDLRLNNAYGLLLLRKGEVAESVKYFRKAIEKETGLTPNPYSGECRMNLGLALQYLGNTSEAFDCFYKATWSNDTAGNAWFRLATVKAGEGDYDAALNFAYESIYRNFRDEKSRVMIASLLEMMGRNAEAEAFVKESLVFCPQANGLLYQIMSPEDFLLRMGTEAKDFVLLAADFISMGLYERAMKILEICPVKNTMVCFYLAYAHEKLFESEKASGWAEKGEKADNSYLFPNTLTDQAVLNCVKTLLPTAPKACLALGNLLYDKRRYKEAISNWENVVKTGEGETKALACRNLSIALFNVKNEGAKAVKAIENAVSLEPENPRYLQEREQLLERTGKSSSYRLKALLKAPKNVVESRDVLYLAYITLLNENERYDEALEAILGHHFHVWEGGEGKVSGEYRKALYALAGREMERENFEKAVSLLEKTLIFPDNLGEGKLPNVPDNQSYYMLGCCYKALGEKTKSEECFGKAVIGSGIPELVRYYNDHPSDYIYYMAKAYYELGDAERAQKLLKSMISFGKKNMNAKFTYDYFAVSLPDLMVYKTDHERLTRMYCEKLVALGNAGLKEIGK